MAVTADATVESAKSTRAWEWRNILAVAATAALETVFGWILFSSLPGSRPNTAWTLIALFYELRS